MKNSAELESEYQEFITKFTKYAKDFNSDLSRLSPENKRRFEKEFKNLVTLNLPNLINFIKNS